MANPIMVLYVEDDPGIARLFQKKMTLLGYQVDLASDGRRGIDKWHSGAYDVIVVDQNMPGKTGIEVIRELAGEERMPCVIMLTGGGDESVAVEALKLGAADYLIKDTDRRFLQLIPSVIEQSLKRRRLEEDKEKAEAALLDANERLRDANDKLEARVKQRTEDLERANTELRNENLTRLKAERALETRLQQQAVAAEVGRLALGTREVRSLLYDAALNVAGGLEVEYAAVLRHVPDADAFIMEAGTGWEHGVVGSAAIPLQESGQWGYTLLSPSPVIVENLNEEHRFDGPQLLHRHGVSGGISLIIRGRERSYGVLAAHAVDRRRFTVHDVHFLEAIANLISAAVERREAEQEIRNAYDELQEAHLDTIHKLAFAAELRDEETGDHIVRMSSVSALIARKLGLSQKHVYNILHASPMHDVGKIAIPDEILRKNGKLTHEEFAIIKQHPEKGARILAGSKSEMLHLAQQIALCHHERWDGKGYPRGLKGEAIPIEGRIVALADVFDVLISERPYKDPYPVDVAKEMIRQGRGTQFDPHITDIFLDNFDEVLKIREDRAGESSLSLIEFSWSERDLLDGNGLSSAIRAVYAG
ncbi:MAG: HD domain-containing phosphohydrolase [Pseudomonadota bacterium]